MSETLHSDMLRISYLIFLTVFVFDFEYIFNDSSIFIHFCRRDVDFFNEICPQCFVDDINQKKWNNLFKNEFDSSLSLNLLFGYRKVWKVTINTITGHQKKAVLKYFSSDDVVKNFKKLLCRYIDCSTSNSFKDVSRLSGILKDMYRLEPHTNSFTICPSYYDSQNFFDTFHHFNGNNLTFWIQLWLNPELVIIKAIQAHRSTNEVLKNAVPDVIDWCGFVLLETDNGSENLIDFYDEPFLKRIHLAKQLIEIAIAFSTGINGFRIYITDSTPDNFVVNRTTLRISFVDLDTLFIVNSDEIKSNQINCHQRIDCVNCFAYVPEELCAFHLSDINLFSVCQIFHEVSIGTTKPFLHSIPDDLDRTLATQLNNLIDLCLNCDKRICSNRFVVASLILSTFENILNSRG